jgi:hypothetical protein
MLKPWSNYLSVYRQSHSERTVPGQVSRLFKHIFRLAILLGFAITMPMAFGAGVTVDLLEGGGTDWRSPDDDHWTFSNGELTGTSRVFDGQKTDPDASTFLVSKATFGGDISVSMEVTFEVGRYLGVYIDFGQDTQTGMWMATGHVLSAGVADNEVERAYIKTVEDSFWIVRTNAELNIKVGEVLMLRFERKGDDYSVWNDDKLIATYHRPGGYPAGPLQLRLVNAKVRIHQLQVRSDWMK